MHARRPRSETRDLSRRASATAAAILLCIALPSTRAQVEDETPSEPPLPSLETASPAGAVESAAAEDAAMQSRAAAEESAVREDGIASDADIERALRSAPDPDALRALLELIARVSDQPLYRGNEARLLVDGPATYAAMLEAIGAAEHHIHLESYIFTDDAVGRRFAAALKEKAEQGVAVRLIYDAIGSRESSEAFFADIERSGAEVHAFNDVTAGGDDGAQLDTRTHRKLLIADRAVAFTGGLNIDGVYAPGSQATGRAPEAAGWRDTHVVIRGPAVAGFDALFIEVWESVTDEQIEAAELPTPDQRAGDALVRVLGAFGGNDSESPIRIAYEAAMEAATRSVLITQSYFAPDDDFTATIKSTAKRGVDVRILVAGISDSSLLLDASRAHYSELLDAGVRIFESQESIMHAKTAVVDGVWSTIGSSNIDSLSFVHNHEVNAAIVDAKLAAELEALFEVDVRNSVEIVPEEWSRRSLWQRIKERWSVLFEERL